MVQAQTLGQWGEREACDWLVGQGYAIVGCNKKVAGVQVDIIAMKDDRICFIEVKTRRSGYIDPIKAVTVTQGQRLLRAIVSFVRTHNIRHYPQIDVITIVGDEHDYKIQHHPDALRPGLRTIR